MSRRSIAIVILVCFASTAALGAEAPFFYSDTRAFSMGGAFIAVAEGGNAIYYNPAGLAWQKGQEVAISGRYQRYIWDLMVGPPPFPSLEYIEGEIAGSYVRHGIGISVYYAKQGDPNEVEYRNEHNELLGTSDWIVRELVVAASFAREVHEKLSLGATAKYLIVDDPLDDFAETPLNFDFNGFTIDVGALWRPRAELSLGLTFDNIVSSEINYYLYNAYSPGPIMAKLPKSISCGIAYRPVEEILIAADLRDVFEDNEEFFDSSREYSFETSYHAGLEWRIVPGFWIRGGYFNIAKPKPYASMESQPYESLNGGSFGFGFLDRGVAIDFGLKGDNRREKMEENPGKVRNTTLSGSMSVSVRF